MVLCYKVTGTEILHCGTCLIDHCTRHSSWGKVQQDEPPASSAVRQTTPGLVRTSSHSFLNEASKREPLILQYFWELHLWQAPVPRLGTPQLNVGSQSISLGTRENVPTWAHAPSSMSALFATPQHNRQGTALNPLVPNN